MFNNSRSGPNNAAEYLASGLPWVTSSTNLTTSPWKIDFPYVTNHLSFCVTGSGAVRVGFTQNGVNGTNFALIPGGTGWVQFDVRCKEIYIRADASVQNVSLMAGLTMIENRGFPILTGSATYNSASNTYAYGYGVSGSAGVGTGLG